ASPNITVATAPAAARSTNIRSASRLANSPKGRIPGLWASVLTPKPAGLISGPMAIREIITAPDPRLKEISKPVDRVDDGLRALMADMLETMYAAPGIGLAAIQVGVPKQV